MGVGVHHAGHYDRAGAVDDFGIGRFGDQVHGFADPCDPVVPYEYASPLKDVIGAVDCDDTRIGKNECHEAVLRAPDLIRPRI